MSHEDAGSVTLIFYKLGEKWYKEPFLNIVAAAAQMSSFTHVELAIGSESGRDGAMTNVARVFNDPTGVELCARTGRNPQYTYLQIGCSKRQEMNMLVYARSCVGKPFSNSAMARSLIWPRQTDGNSFFCAELVAAILKQGGLIDSSSNPGAATPQGLHELYKNRAATTANPYLLRQTACKQQLTTSSVVAQRHYTPPNLQLGRNQIRPHATSAPHVPRPVTTAYPREQPRYAAPSARYPCAFTGSSSWNAPTEQTSRVNGLRILNAGDASLRPERALPMGITLHSLDFRAMKAQR
jgi:hypothetical protein